MAMVRSVNKKLGMIGFTARPSMAYSSTHSNPDPTAHPRIAGEPQPQSLPRFTESSSSSIASANTTAPP